MRWLNNAVPRLSFGTLGWIVLLGYLAYQISPHVAAAFGAGRGGERMPAVALRTLDGSPVTRESLEGKVVLVNFWATWCPPCRFEMPGFQRVYEAHRDEGFVILGISTDGAGERSVREFLRERGITYPVALATSRVVNDFGGVQALPTSFLIGRDGRIRQQVRGVFAEPALRMAVKRLLAEPAAGGAR